MTTTDTTTAPLTMQDVTALKQAEVVVFRYYRQVATIEASLRGHLTQPRIFTAAQQRLFPEVNEYERKHTIPVDGLVTYYDDDSRRTAGPEASAFSMFHSANYSHIWVTIASLLKPGDVLLIHFNGDRYANGYSRKTDLHIDALHLDVKRGKKALSFVVDICVAPDNSARMVKPNGGF